MTEFLKAYWPWIALIAVLAALGLAASEYIDAAPSMLPGGEGTGGER
jgi:hypothetical protein